MNAWVCKLGRKYWCEEYCEFSWLLRASLFRTKKDALHNIAEGEVKTSEHPVQVEIKEIR